MVTTEKTGSTRPDTRPTSGLATFLVLLALVGLVTLVVLALARLAGSPGPASSRSEPRASRTPPTPSCPIPTAHNARVIQTVYSVGVARKASGKQMLAAFEAGWVESRMHNLPCGDRDSLGVFQQRPSQGWGSPEQIRDVRYASHRFFARAKAEHRVRPHLTAGQLAQRVQRSAFPKRYDQAEPKARVLLEEARKGADRDQRLDSPPNPRD